jgi:HSP20 family molecular chaperone IbpA
MDAGDIEVSVGRDTLTLRGVHCRFGAFERVVRLPDRVQGDARRIAVERSQLTIDLVLDDTSYELAC